MGNHKAGMCRNPFGGRERLDKCNLQGPSILGDCLVDVFSDIPGERTLIVEMFKDTVLNYLYFGLGRNGTSAAEFFYSSEFLLRVRASDPETWRGARLMRSTYVDELTGKRVTRTVALADDTLKAMCSDYLWNLLAMPMPFDLFISELRKARCQILTENKQQILDFIDDLNRPSLARNILVGEQIPMKFFSQDIDQVLMEPKNPEDVAELVCYQPAKHRSRQPACAVKPARVKALQDAAARAVTVVVVREAPAKGELW